MRHITVDDGFGWDDEVDVICTDTAPGGLATAIAAARAGGAVMLASAELPASETDWFGSHQLDDPTATYLHELTADIELESLPRPSVDLPVRLASPLPHADEGRKRRIDTFDGAHLRDWAMQCIPARTGYLYTRVTGWDTAAWQSGDGSRLAVSEIGAMSPDVDDVGGSVSSWLTAAAEDAGVSFDRSTVLQRLVFDDGVVVGAEFDTAEGALTVRARHGVLLCRAVEPLASPTLPQGAEVRVALVGRLASRFGRVELLTADPAVAAAAGACVQLSGSARHRGA
ncbi:MULTISPECIES: hypothetical protein [Mycobacteriaceae]|uniref:Uncharacterized protein n=1 Tax=Mycolicibacterium parafortuitum TaxID=39692 RepID=A0ACC6MKX0_MYCPF|nr:MULTISPECIES: hypothetical protein [Mycobacteriaceae]MDZ5087618.1 hypothetical protein [Mycolicibacterium parafortuitum]